MCEDRDYEDRDERPARRVKREKQPKEIRYKFALAHSGKTPEVRGSGFKLGDVVGTQDGPHVVREVFWISPHEAWVILKRTDKSIVKPAAVKKPKRK